MASTPAAPRFDTLVENAQVGVYVVQDHRLVYANARLAAMFGYAPADLLALPSVYALVAADDRDTVAEMLRRRTEGEVDSVRYAWRGRRADGTIIDLESLSGRTEWNGQPAVSGTIIDITERRAAERALAEREQRLRMLFDQAQDVVFTCDAAGRLTSLNQAGMRLLAGEHEPTLPGRLLDAIVPEERERAAQWIAAGGAEPSQQDFTFVTPAGQRLLLELRVQPMHRDAAAPELLGIARDVTDRRTREEALRNLSIVDDLTGLYNRRGFQTLAERHLKLAVRKQSGVFLLFCDVDGLKDINDTHGHLEGDRALTDAASILRSSFRSADIIARLGGDEFTVFPLEAAGESGELLIRRLEDNLAAHNASADRPYRLTMSVGIARFEPGSSWTIAQLLDAADRHLYDQRRKRR